MELELEGPSRIQEEITIFNERIRKISLNNSVGEEIDFRNEEDDSEDDPELTELLRLIECPVCKDTPAPPIYNCCNGHFVCDPCRAQLSSQKCAYCFAKFTQMRNYPLEAILTIPSIQCDFAKYGCSKKKLSLIEYDEHMRKCWAKFWQPGKIITNFKRSPGIIDDEQEDNNKPRSPCPKCNHNNPSRKVKCQMCDHSPLRVPTPMYLPFDYECSESTNEGFYGVM